MKAMALCVLAALLALTGCSVEAMARKGVEVLDKVELIADQARDTVAKIEARAKEADTDGDGKLSWEEIVALLLGGGGLLSAQQAKASREKTQREVDELYDDLHKVEASKA